MTAGTYAGGTLGWPWGGGFGLYFDNRGRTYPQLYGGTPRLNLSAGYTPDLEGLLTGPSVSGSAGIGSIRFNGAGSGQASGYGIGTPGVGVTHGFGPYELSGDFSRPLARQFIRDSAVSAGVPGRNNVFEYGFPEPGPKQPSKGSVFDAGAPPISFLPPASQEASGGLPGMMMRAGVIDPSNPDAPPPGGLVGLLQDYLRTNLYRRD
jgi:hypothetical protein